MKHIVVSSLQGTITAMIITVTWALMDYVIEITPKEYNDVFFAAWSGATTVWLIK